jgi:hypothetical protein
VHVQETNSTHLANIPHHTGQNIGTRSLKFSAQSRPSWPSIASVELQPPQLQEPQAQTSLQGLGSSTLVFAFPAFSNCGTAYGISKRTQRNSQAARGRMQGGVVILHFWSRGSQLRHNCSMLCIAQPMLCSKPQQDGQLAWAHQLQLDDKAHTRGWCLQFLFRVLQTFSVPTPLLSQIRGRKW